MILSASLLAITREFEHTQLSAVTRENYFQYLAGKVNVGQEILNGHSSKFYSLEFESSKLWPGGQITLNLLIQPQAEIPSEVLRFSDESFHMYTYFRKNRGIWMTITAAMSTTVPSATVLP